MDSQIPPLTLPSGGTVEFIDLDDLTGEDLHDLRGVISSADSGGVVTNKLMRAAMRVGIKTWDISYLPDPRTPQANEAAWKKLRARDLAAIEKAIQPVLSLINPDRETKDDGSPGSPPRPGSE